MRSKKNYNTPAMSIVGVEDDVVRTSEEAPDVYTKDPFIRK